MSSNSSTLTSRESIYRCLYNDTCRELEQALKERDEKLKKREEKLKKKEEARKEHEKRDREFQQLDKSLQHDENKVKRLKREKELQSQFLLLPDSSSNATAESGDRVAVKTEEGCVEIIEIVDDGDNEKVKAQPVEVIDVDKDVEDDDDGDKKPNSMKDDDSHKSDGGDDCVKESSNCKEEMPPGKKKASDESKDTLRENSYTAKKQSAAKVALERDADDNKYEYCDKAQAEELARPKAEHLKKSPSATTTATRAKKDDKSSYVEKRSKFVSTGEAKQDDISQLGDAEEEQKERSGWRYFSDGRYWVPTAELLENPSLIGDAVLRHKTFKYLTNQDGWYQTVVFLPEDYEQLTYATTGTDLLPSADFLVQPDIVKGAASEYASSEYALSPDGSSKFRFNFSVGCIQQLVDEALKWRSFDDLAATDCKKAMKYAKQMEGPRVLGIPNNPDDKFSEFQPWHIRHNESVQTNLSEYSLQLGGDLTDFFDCSTAGGKLGSTRLAQLRKRGRPALLLRMGLCAGFVDATLKLKSLLIVIEKRGRNQKTTEGLKQCGLEMKQLEQRLPT